MDKADGRFYLSDEDVRDVGKAETFHELVVVALRVIDRMRPPVVQVCGPISTGGKGSVEENIRALADAIKDLTASGINVFNQLPFEKALGRIMQSYKVEGYDTPILEEFYGPLFESGGIVKVYFLPGWEKSIGASWEYKYAKNLGIETVFL